MTSVLAIFVVFITLTASGIGAAGALYLTRSERRPALPQYPAEGDHWVLYGVGRVQIRELLTRDDGKRVVCFVQDDEQIYAACWMALNEFMDKASPEVQHRVRGGGRLDRITRMRQRWQA